MGLSIYCSNCDEQIEITDDSVFMPDYNTIMILCTKCDNKEILDV